MTTPSFTCPRCGMISYNPLDVIHGYCGMCHAFTRENAVEVVDYLDIMPAVERFKSWTEAKEQMDLLKDIAKQPGVRILPWRGHNLYRTVHGVDAPPDKAFTLEEIVELCKAYIEMKKDS